MSGPRPSSERREVLYVIACGAPLARHVGRLVELDVGIGELLVVLRRDRQRAVLARDGLAAEDQLVDLIAIDGH